MDKYIGKVILVVLPNSKRPRYRWIVQKREDGRYISRVPKVGVLLKNLHFKRVQDYGEETVLPLGAKPFSIRTKKAAASKKRRTKTAKKK
jgi:hypothetical protein